MDIILYLLQLIQYQHKQICWLLNFICRYIPLKQWAFDDSHSPKYQKFKSISFLSSKPLSNRTGSFFLNTTSGNMASLSNQFSAVMVNPFRKIPSTLCVGLRITTFMTIMGVTVNTSVKSVASKHISGSSWILKRNIVFCFSILLFFIK